MKSLPTELNTNNGSPENSNLGCVERYELLLRLGGKGSYKARDQVTNEEVVLRFLDSSLFGAKKEISRLRDCLAMVARLHHPRLRGLRHMQEILEADNVAREETGCVNGVPMLILDYVPGQPLDSWLQQRGSLENTEALALLTEISEALTTAHNVGLTHGHLHPANVIIGADGAVVCDLALAQTMAQVARDSGREIAESELLAIQDNPSVETDVFSLATLAFQMLTGKRYAHSETPFPDSLAGQVLHRELDTGSGIPFATCNDFIAALQVAIQEDNAQPEPLPTPPPPAPIPVETPAPAEAPAPAPATPPPVERKPPSLAIPPVSYSPFAQPEDKKKKRTNGRSWGFVALVSVLVLLIIGLTAGVFLKQLERGKNKAVQIPAPKLEWTTLKENKRLSPSFAWRAVLASPLGDDGQLRLRFFGQTCIMDASLKAETMEIGKTIDARGKTILEQVPLASPLKIGDVFSVVKTPDMISVYLNNVRLAATPCPLEDWRLGRWGRAGEFNDPKFAYQKIGRLVFADDFMHGEDEFGEWKPVSGEWTIHSIDNPIRSANPFSFSAKGENALATTGHWFWRNYRVSCSLHPLNGSSFGLKFCRIDEQNVYELLWTTGNDGQAFLELTRVANGGRTSLRKVNASFLSESWIRLEASQLNGLISISVDGKVAFQVIDPNPLLGGGVALWSRGGEGTVFDDFEVGPADRMEISVENPPSTASGILLQNVNLTARIEGLANAVDPVDLVIRRSDPQALFLRLQPGEKWQAQVMVRNAEGEQKLTAVPIALSGTMTDISLHALGKEVWAELDGQLIVQVTNGVPGFGRGTCEVRGTGKTPNVDVRLRSIAVSPELALPAIANRVETFTHEASMQNWSNPVLEWLPRYDMKQPTYWHRSDFWSDAAVDVDMEKLLAQNKDSVWGAAMEIAAPPAQEEGGKVYQLYLLPREENLTLELPDGSVKKLPFSGKVRQLSLARRGDRALARLNGNVIWTDKIGTSGDGLCQLGRIGRGATTEWALAVNLRAQNLQTYSFKEAPGDWLPASGDWKITNRWQCDPRWSFFSGVKLDGPVCLWNKRRLGKNLTIEFFIGPKMDRSRGNSYEYAGDFNAVVCADGKDISSGYSFMFGGWNDRGSQIVRQKEILLESRSVYIPRKKAIHRRWFHVKLRKRGDLLAFWVDGVKVGEVRDPQPLTGDRFGLWSWRNGIMVAQFRVATDSPMPSLGVKTPVVPNPQTPYDK